MGHFKIDNNGRMQKCLQNSPNSFELSTPLLEQLLNKQDWTTSIGRKANLDKTDWKVTRHRDQLDIGITPSLTDEEYRVLLTKRQEWRDGIVDTTV